MLIINGQRDIRVPSAQAIKMYQALYDAGVEAEQILNDRAPHGDLGAEAAAAIKVVCTTSAVKEMMLLTSSASPCAGK